MAFLVNKTHGTKVLGGVTLPPLGMGNSDAPRSELENHLFVRTGCVELSGSNGSSTPKRGRKPKRQEVESPEPERPESADE